MNSPEPGQVDRHMRIPKIFRSSDTGKLFEHCMICDRFLLNEGTPYMIEKAVKQYPELKVKEVIFEYAICFNCALMMNESLSFESRQRINAYFERHGNWVERRERLLQHKTTRVEPWINRCLIKGTPISKSTEFQLAAQCDGKYLLFTYLPFALSAEALDEITSLLSPKSLGEIDDFMGNYFSGPPEIAELLKRRPLVLV